MAFNYIHNTYNQLPLVSPTFNRLEERKHFSRVNPKKRSFSMKRKEVKIKLEFDENTLKTHGKKVCITLIRILEN